MHPLDYEFEQVRKIQALQKELYEVEQILGKALDFPRYCDDQKNFPGTTDADGVCTGDLTPVDLAKLAAEQMERDDKLMQAATEIVKTMTYYVNTWREEDSR